MLQFFMVFIGALFLLYVVSLVVREKLLLRYSLLWMALTIVLVFFALFPRALGFLAGVFGFDLTSNFIFAVAAFFLLAVCLSLSVVASKQALAIKNLTQQIALMGHEIESKDNRTKSRKA